MSGDGKRSVGKLPQATAPILDSTIAAPDVYDGTSAVGQSGHPSQGASVGQPTESCLGKFSAGRGHRSSAAAAMAAALGLSMAIDKIVVPSSDHLICRRSSQRVYREAKRPPHPRSTFMIVVAPESLRSVNRRSTGAAERRPRTPLSGLARFGVAVLRRHAIIVDPGQGIVAGLPEVASSRCSKFAHFDVEMGHEPPRRSLAAVTGLHPIPAAPSRPRGGG